MFVKSNITSHFIITQIGSGQDPHQHQEVISLEYSVLFGQLYSCLVIQDVFTNSQNILPLCRELEKITYIERLLATLPTFPAFLTLCAKEYLLQIFLCGYKHGSRRKKRINQKMVGITCYK